MFWGNKERWDGTVEELEQLWNKNWIERKTLHDVITRELSGCKTVLNAGCGTGQDYSLFTDIDYLGIDITDEMLVKHREKYPQAKVELGNINHLIFPNRHFDMVLCNDVLIHIRTPFKAFQELWRVTKKKLILKLCYVWDRPTQYDVAPTGYLETKFNLTDIMLFIKELPALASLTVDSVTPPETTRNFSLKQIFVMKKE